MSNRTSSKASTEADERDEAPILGSHFFRTGALKAGDVILRPATDTMARRGRPPHGKSAKIQQSLRLSPEVLDHFRSGGKGWQARIDEVLRHVVEHERALAVVGRLSASTPAEARVKEEAAGFSHAIPDPGGAETIDPRFKEAFERLASARAAMLEMSRPERSTPAVATKRKKGTRGSPA